MALYIYFSFPFREDKFYGGIEGLKDTIYRDKIKREWLAKNNIPYLDIPYNDEKKVSNIIENYLIEQSYYVNS